MFSTGIFTTHRWQMPEMKINEVGYVLPFGDLHWGSSNFHHEKFDEWCGWASKKPRASFIGMGDYMDMLSGSERIQLDGKLHESTHKTLDDLYISQTLSLAKKLKPLKTKTIGLLEGNHFAVLSSGITTTQLLCQELGCKYLGVSAFVTLVFKYSTREVAIDVWAHHGKGAGFLAGSGLNTLDKMQQTAEADLYLMGHTHEKSVAFKDRLRLTHPGNSDAPRLSHRKVVLCCTGSFLRGYVPAPEDMITSQTPFQQLPRSYIADKGLRPTSLGTVKVEATLRRSQTKNDKDFIYVDLHATG
jgi:hypothetical protein